MQRTKRILAALLLLLLPCFISFTATAQEPPEPTTVDMTSVEAEDFQVSWYGGGWTTVTAIGWTDPNGTVHPAVEFLDGIPAAAHKHVVGLGRLVLEAVSPDSIPDAERFVRFGIPVSAVPDNPPGTLRWWGIVRVRWRCRAQADSYTSDPSVWSQQSWWILVIGMFTVSVPINT